MQPQPVPTPPGFVLLGMLLATLGVGCAIGVASTDTGHVARALFGVVAMLSLVLVEALWWVRPWVVRTADAWMVACIGAGLFAGLVTTSGQLEALLTGALLALCFVGLPCTAVHWYVRDRAFRLGLAPGTAP
ncbi:MAG TPA: hypothetical protein VGO40_18575 [Longimicrobium sp.]|jgi:hypothetical protein|nr:hypothetical protein [Longimicrobium sp.]